MLGANPANAATSLLYTGEMYDSSASMYYLRARWYDQQTGRFNRMDPFAGNTQDPQSLHKYLYAHCNPTNGIDPSGKSAIHVAIAVAAFVVAASYLAWAYISPRTFGKWGAPSAYWARWKGQEKIETYRDAHLDEIIEAKTYKHVDATGKETSITKENLRKVFDAYITLYPQVTSRTCLAARDDLMLRLNAFVGSDPEISKYIMFRGAVLWTTAPEPDNFLVLWPTHYRNESGLGIALWYNHSGASTFAEQEAERRAKKNIIFFYPGSRPCSPVGNAYKAVAEDSWGPCHSMEFD